MAVQVKQIRTVDIEFVNPSDYQTIRVTGSKQDSNPHVDLPFQPQADGYCRPVGHGRSI